MNIWQRRTYFILAIIVFVIVATLLILYASGWRYNIKTNYLEKVGSITIETVPKNASVFLNGKLYKEKTPVSINSVIADEYKVRIEKENYNSWEKIVTVEPSRATHLSSIYLLKKQENIDPLLSDEFSNIFISPDFKKFVGLKNTDLYIYELDGLKKIYSITLNSTVDEALWSADSNKVIYSSDNLFTLINSWSEAVTINEYFGIAPSQVFWSDKENEIIYATADNKLYRLNEYQKTTMPILNKENIVHVANGFYFNLQNDTLAVYDNSENLVASTNLQTNAKLVFYPAINNYLPILDSNNQTAYFMDQATLELNKLNENINNIQIDDDKKLLLLSNNHEIWQWDIQKSAKELIIRTSEEIIDAVWLLNKHYTLYITADNEIHLLETTGSEKNRYSLAIGAIEKIFKVPNRDTLFIFANQKIYKLEF